MANFSLLIAVLLFIGCSGSFDGLNNHSKAFTSPRDITPEDWSDPAESERAWQAAPVRIPADNGAFISSQITELDRNLISAFYQSVFTQDLCVRALKLKADIEIEPEKCSFSEISVDKIIQLILSSISQCPIKSIFLFRIACIE